MYKEIIDNILNDAKEVLNNNWKDGFTIPTEKLYPFQWNWDSGFVSLGWMHLNMAQAMNEIDLLFSGQWENGMLPHIIFHSENETTYFPNHDFWESEVNIGSPIKPRTSGITQPPVHGFVLEKIFEKGRNIEVVRNFVKKMFPKIRNLHRFFYDYRDPLKEGLIFIYHPWESGRDNSPLWDESMQRIEIDKLKIPTYVRKDTDHTEASERPTQDKYDRFVYILELGKKYKYENSEIFEESPFLIQDSMFNAILIKSNDSLIHLGKELKFDTGEIEEWHTQSVHSYAQKLWSPNLNFYTCYDMSGDCLIPYREVGGLASLYANVPDKKRSTILNDYLINLHKRGFYLCPSFDPDSDLFDSRRYWRGPIWPQINWLVNHGLMVYGFNDTADIVKNDLLEIVQNLGYYEYFESDKDKVSRLTQGYGGANFSWTASTVIDFLHYEN